MARYLACYMGTPPTSGEAPPQDVIQKGMDAWQKWMEDNAPVIVDTGGPLGKTKSIDGSRVSDTSNALTGYVILAADSHDVAAALFENHPHFAIFPGDAVEVMPVMPMPGG